MAVIVIRVSARVCFLSRLHTYRFHSYLIAKSTSASVLVIPYTPENSSTVNNIGTAIKS
jgi:hypothetical protein